jgi:nucleoside-diphosphate-sugar epimerase
MSQLSTERYLVTGAYGCIGAWVVRELLEHGAYVVGYDLAATSHRIPLIVDEDDATRLVSVQADITDLAALESTLDQHAITRIIHLAALQVPFCRANPPAGAAVNVVGTANVFEAVAKRLDQIPHVVFASSIAAYDAYVPGQSPAMHGTPSTVYGVYKRATEQLAAVYAAEREVPSIGLRPHTVYGPGRDQGLTSSPTVAMLAATAGRRFNIPYSGVAQFQHAQDAAHVFAQATQATVSGAHMANLAGQITSIAEIVQAIETVRPDSIGLITYDGAPLAFPEQVPSDNLSFVIGGPVVDRNIVDGISASIAQFEQAIGQNKIDVEAALPR